MLATNCLFSKKAKLALRGSIEVVSSLLRCDDMYLYLLAGYRSDGYNKDRYSRTGYNCQSVDDNLLSEDGLSIGFNYSCQVSSVSECLSTAATGFPNSEVRLTYTVTWLNKFIMLRSS